VQEWREGDECKKIKRRFCILTPQAMKARTRKASAQRRGTPKDSKQST